MLKKIKANNPLAFEEWRLKTGLSKKARFKTDSMNVQIITGVEINIYPFQNFFTYFENLSIYGYAPHPHYGNLINAYIKVFKDRLLIKYYFLQEKTKLNFSGKTRLVIKMWDKDQSTECRIACFEEMFKIHNKQLEDK